MASQIVYPGDSIGIAEEFVAGPGTYEENGEVYAAMLGRLVLDTTSFEARVEPFPKPPAVLNIGDVVIGRVNMTRSSMAIVEVLHKADQPDRDLAGDTNGTLHVSKSSERYVESMEDIYHPRDIVRALVLGVDPAIQLTTKGPRFGVLVSYCPRCSTRMERKGNALACPECEWKATSKMAEDYGEGNVL